MKAARTILIADDDQDMLKITTIYLSRWGYKVVTAEDGQEVLTRARQHKPDLILLDIRMPVLKGIEVCQQLKADEELKKIPVIAMTALSGIFSPDVFRSMKADDYLAKPFEPGELFDRIQRFLGRSNTQT